MKKKILIFMLALFIGLPCTFSLVGCKEKEANIIALNNNMLTLEYSQTFYNGLEKEPEVTVEVNQSTIPVSEYSVTYSDNINVGTAKVIVSAKENSTLISGSASTSFNIVTSRVIVKTYEDLKLVIENPNYSNILLMQDIVIPSTDVLTIPENKTLSIGSNNLTVNGTLINNGQINVEVNSKDGLQEAFEYATNITLTDDIQLNGTNLVLNAENRNYTIDLDLNGHSILGYFKIYAKSTYSANVNIKNYMGESFIGIDNDINCQYGIAAMGNNINLTLFGVNLVGYYGGIATNGRYEGAKISATNSTFKGVSEELGNNSSLGAYLPAKNEYNFINCTFEGSSAYYAKSGTHSLTNCTFNATQTTYEIPKHYGSGGNATGSALIVDSSEGYKTPLNITIYNATINSLAGYGIEEYCSGNVEDYSTTNYYGQLIYNTLKDNFKLWESPVA